MAKESYKIPTSLDASYTDLEFTLKNKDGFGLNNPISGRVILLILISTIGLMFMLFKSFMASGGPFAIAGFIIFWVALSILLVWQDKTKRHGYQLILSMLDYLPKTSRFIPLKQSDKAMNLRKLTGLENVDPEDALIHFMDGTIGRMLHVVGSASVLMFDQDKAMILNKVDNFYQKMPVGVEIIYDTVKESQRVHEQVQAAKMGLRNLEGRSAKSKGLHKLYKERQTILEYGVGKQFKSIHQYAIIKAPNEEALQELEHLFMGDAENEGLMFKKVERLSADETAQYFYQTFSEYKKV